MELNQLLERQLNRHLPESWKGLPELQSFLKAVNDAYSHYEEERELLEHTMNLNSSELEYLLDRTRKESETQKAVLSDLKNILEKLQDNDLATEAFVGEDISNLTSILKRELEIKQLVSKDLVEKETNMTALIENRSDIIFSLDTNYRIIIYNSHFFHHPLFPEKNKPAKGKSILDLVPEDLKVNVKSLLDKSFRDNKFSIETDYTLFGDKRYYRVSFNSIKHEGKVIGTSVFANDITLRKEQEITIQKNLLEKETLLKEIHHRVKNNMQVIMSLLSLQARAINEKGSQELYNVSQHRIQSMAMIHEMLYKSENFQKIDYGVYLRNLIEMLIDSMKGKDNKISLKLEINSISLGIDTAIPLGLIINEMVTNSLKHGIEQEGEIYLSIEDLDEKKYRLKIGDTGVGMPEDPEINNPKSLGLKLMNYLSEQIEGNVRRDLKKKGTHYIIDFKDL